MKTLNLSRYAHIAFEDLSFDSIQKFISDTRLGVAPSVVSFRSGKAAAYVETAFQFDLISFAEAQLLLDQLL